MRLWLLVALVCLVQEFATTNAVLLAAYHAGYSLWIIHAMYLAGTIIDFFIGYWLGVWVHEKLSQSALARWAADFVAHHLNRLGTIGRRYLLFIIGALNFTYLDAFIVPWLRVPWPEAFVLFVVGNMLWYAFQWSFVLGINVLFPNPFEALVAVVVLSLVGMALWKVGIRRLFGRW